LAGDNRLAEELADRVEGKSQQSVEIERPSELHKVFDRVSHEGLKAHARDGTLPDWFLKNDKHETVQ
jgi:hypothetical protein